MGSHSLDAPPVPRLICTLWLTRLLIGSKVLRHPRREGCNSRHWVGRWIFVNDRPVYFGTRAYLSLARVAITI